MALCHLAEYKHGQLVLVSGHVDCGINRCNLELVRCNLVVLSLCRNTHLPKLAVKLPHEICNLELDIAVVVAVEFLSLSRHGTIEGALTEHQV